MNDIEQSTKQLTQGKPYHYRPESLKGEILAVVGIFLLAILVLL